MHPADDPTRALRPLADRMRPRTIDEVVGQDHLIAPGRPLGDSVRQGLAHSMVLWGPPGVGKTSLARLLAHHLDATFLSLSAVLAGVKDIRDAVARARADAPRRTIVFVDEVHRFNKAQQDAFLPHIEAGTITFVGATTENPSFELNSALLSRVRVYVLKAVAEPALSALIDHALSDGERGLGGRRLVMSDEARRILIRAADGDCRRALNLLEIASDLVTAAPDAAQSAQLTAELVREVTREGTRRFDKQGEDFYDQISALHKSVRGSDPDAALYWLARMIDGGCDLGYLARRITRMASEDIGNADPRALALCLQAWDSAERLGQPEGELALAQAAVYLACAAKSNAVYRAYQRALRDVREHGSLEVPLPIRNAPTRLLKDLNYSKGYRYAHDEPDAFAAGMVYMPDALADRLYYEPVDRGLEARIRERLHTLRARNRAARRTSEGGEA